jgi:hypothetical protein
MITGKPKEKVVLATGGLAVGGLGGGPLTSNRAKFGLRGFNVADENNAGWLNAIVTLLTVCGTARLLVIAKTPA